MRIADRRQRCWPASRAGATADPGHRRARADVLRRPTSSCSTSRPSIRAAILAGATDVGLWVTKQQRRLDPVIWLGRVAGLARIEETEDAIHIGAGVTYAAAHERLAGLWPDVGELVRRLGAEQIRHAGTIGGNIANGSPIGDSPPWLIAAGATLHLAHRDGRRSLPLEDFFLAYGKQDQRPGRSSRR